MLNSVSWQQSEAVNCNDSDDRSGDCGGDNDWRERAVNVWSADLRLVERELAQVVDVEAEELVRAGLDVVVLFHGVACWFLLL